MSRDVGTISSRRWAYMSALNQRELPSGVVALLHAARRDEQESLGPHRRSAFRFTRHLISGILSAGYPARVLAFELGIRPESLRDRAQAGVIPIYQLAALCGFSDGQLVARCQHAGITILDGHVHSDDLVLLLLTQDPPAEADADQAISAGESAGATHSETFSSVDDR